VVQSGTGNWVLHTHEQPLVSKETLYGGS
jgi:hypothetical protein